MSGVLIRSKVPGSVRVVATSIFFRTGRSRDRPAVSRKRLKSQGPLSGILQEFLIGFQKEAPHRLVAPLLLLLPLLLGLVLAFAHADFLCHSDTLNILGNFCEAGS